MNFNFSLCNHIHYTNCGDSIETFNRATQTDPITFRLFSSALDLIPVPRSCNCRPRETREAGTQTLVAEVVEVESSTDTSSPIAPVARDEPRLYPDITPSGSEDTLEYLERFVRSPETTVVRKGPRSPWQHQE